MASADISRSIAATICASLVLDGEGRLDAQLHVEKVEK